MRNTPQSDPFDVYLKYKNNLTITRKQPEKNRVSATNFVNNYVRLANYHNQCDDNLTY